VARVIASVAFLACFLGRELPDPARAAPACDVTPVATLPLTLADRHAYVTVQIEGADVRMLVDTGAAVTALDRTTADRLGLHRDARSKRTAVIGIGGPARAADVLIAGSLDIGGLHLAHIPLASIDIGAGQPPAARIAGILGADILSRYDLDLDPARGRLVLHAAASCANGLPDWSEPYQAVPLTPVRGSSLMLAPVAIDGRPMAALVDTGATQSVLFAPALRRLGNDAVARPTDRTGYGLGAVAGRRIAAVMHRFRSMQVGRETLDRPDLAMVREGPPGLDMLLGLDYLGRHHIWISNATRRMFIATP
jgi:clan AA aspartic protease (TIGR02281 family)